MVITCEKCGTQHPNDLQVCPSCGHDHMLELEIDAFLTPAIERARKWLLAVGILYLIGAGIDYYRVQSALNELSAFGIEIPMPTEMWIALALQAGFGLVHIGLWSWAKTEPFYASVVALVLFITLSLAVAMLISPAHMFSILRAIFLIVLLMAVSAAYKARKLRQARGDADLPSARLL